MTFRTPNEAVELAKQHRLRPSRLRWSESTRLPPLRGQLKAGVIWVNCTNMLDAAAASEATAKAATAAKAAKKAC